jgi:hypothetical protein
MNKEKKLEEINRFFQQKLSFYGFSNQFLSELQIISVSRMKESFDMLLGGAEEEVELQGFEIVIQWDDQTIPIRSLEYRNYKGYQTTPWRINNEWNLDGEPEYQTYQEVLDCSPANEGDITRFFSVISEDLIIQIDQFIGATESIKNQEIIQKYSGSVVTLVEKNGKSMIVFPDGKEVLFT